MENFRRTAICFVFFAHSIFANEPLEGFLWYNEKAEEVKEEKRKEEKDLGTVAQTDIERDKKAFEDALNIALYKPTIENLTKFLHIQQKIVDKSSKFAEMLSIAALLDSSIPENTMLSPLSMDISRKMENLQKEELLTNLHENWGLILQIENDCPFCMAFGRIVSAFAQKYQLQLVALSDKDSQFFTIKTLIDTGILSDKNPERKVPNLFLIKHDGTEVIQVAKSLITEDQIIDNVIKIDTSIMRLS